MRPVGTNQPVMVYWLDTKMKLPGARDYLWREGQLGDSPKMDAFEISQLILDQRRLGRSYLEFLRLPALSVGLYSLSAGGVDPQKPHLEDEVYYVVSGRGTIRVGAEERTVEPGTIVFVAAGVEHRFHTITEDLTMLVFFAPAESET